MPQKMRGIGGLGSRKVEWQQMILGSTLKVICFVAIVPVCSGWLRLGG